VGTPPTDSLLSGGLFVSARASYQTVLGMLAFEVNNRDFRRIWVFYVFGDEQEAVYDSEIRESYLESESYIDYTLWLTDSRRRITAASDRG
jgi:hypothetical protein